MDAKLQVVSWCIPLLNKSYSDLIIEVIRNGGKPSKVRRGVSRSSEEENICNFYGYIISSVDSSSNGRPVTIHSGFLSMALLIFPRFHSFPSSFLPSPVRRCRFFSAAASTQVDIERKKYDDVALLWFKHDLRSDDHPGLVAASQRQTVVPLYIFDHRILSRFSDEMLELVLLALEDLREWLKSQGSNLMIRFGSAENVILELIQEVKATHVFLEEEVEYNLRRMIDIVEGSLSSVTFSSGSPQLVRWQTPFYDIQNLAEVPASYRDFKKLQYPITTPMVPPFVPGLNMELDWGTIPTLSDVKTFMIGNPHKSEKSWTSIKEISAKTILGNERISLSEMQNYPDQSMRNINSVVNNRSNMDSKDIQRKRLQNSVFLSRKGNLLGGGTDILLNALAAYLRYLEGTARDDWQEVHDKLCNAETKSGASFGALFGSALSVGVISRRRVYFEAIKYERECNAGFLFPFGYSVSTVAAAVNAVCSMEWYWLLALKSQISGEGRYSVRIWRWKGYLIQYTVVGHEGPAVLLVHGFGAFLEHFRDNIYAIADGGNHVWAITLLGFGKSEKPNIVYTELMWAELLRDFIVDVVNEPVHLVGNSIGGYFSAIVAGLWPALVKSVGLINTAGSVEPGYSSFPVTEEGRVSGGAAWFGSRLLVLYLRLSVGNIVKNCYPSNTERADGWLVGEMIRASYDPGVLPVLESIFTFNLEIPLNYLLDSFGGKVIIIQGLKDPLTKSKLKVSMFREYCNGVVIRELNAGHCPHDEQPDEVNSILCKWIKTVESNLRPLEGILF